MNLDDLYQNQEEINKMLNQRKEKERSYKTLVKKRKELVDKIQNDKELSQVEIKYLYSVFKQNLLSIVNII